MFSFKPIPAPLTWLNEPVSTEVDQQGSTIWIGAGPETDWFIDPAGGRPKTNAPIALFSPPDSTCLLAARITLNFAATYDAGVLFVFANPTHWAKLCFEYSPQNRPAIVSVVTRGVSDDCNSMTIARDTVFLRVYRQRNVFAFHASEDGRFWHLNRYFGFDTDSEIKLGLSAQSPLGNGVVASFSEVTYQKRGLEDIRNGE